MFLDNPFLTESDCMTIIRKNSRRKDPTINSMSIKSLTGREGFSGQHLIVTIDYQDDPQLNPTSKRYFLKALNNTYRILFEMCKTIQAYEKEDFFYTVLIKELESQGIKTSFAPKAVLCKPYVIVLEDLSIEGYKNAPKWNMFDVEHCKMGLKCLAEFHGSVISYEQKKIMETGTCELFGKYQNCLQEVLLTNTDNLGKRCFDTTMEGLYELIKLVPLGDDISSEEFIRKLKESFETSKKLVSSTNKYKQCIIHRDLWTNNFLIKYDNDKPVNFVLIDYQLLKYGPLALDPVQMLLTNLRKKPRDKHFYYLLEFYYKTFEKTLSLYGFRAGSIITFEDFIRSCDDMRIPAKLHATFGHTFTFLTDADLEKGFQSEAATMNFMFGDKRDSIKKSYEENDLYREILQEDLLELRDLIFFK